ncbi:dirigent protein 22-like [Primulina eburnea]|uniref:dirigent protein 22-like n=1 Tax=Primulina eburnea TaxID=1245227 RepID=UPI003C6C0747
MAKFRLGTTFVLFTYFHAMVLLCQGIQPIDKWFQKIKLLPIPKYAIIEFYQQVVFAGDGETSYEIARSSITSTSPTFFGSLSMEDNLLTTGPDPRSPPIGRAQGLLGFSDLNEIAVYQSLNFIFKEGLYSGSTISVFGRRLGRKDEQELSVVGGTGDFRLARGIAVLSTYVLNTTGTSTFKYTLYITYI